MNFLSRHRNPVATATAIVCASLASLGWAQESVTFTNVPSDGNFGSSLNAIRSHTFTNSFLWGGEIQMSWVRGLAPNRPQFDNYARVHVMTSSNGSSLSAWGSQPLTPGTGPRFGWASYPTNSLTVAPIGYTSPFDPQGQTFDFQFFRDVVGDTLPGPEGIWSSITFTFLPYTPPTPPVHNSPQPGRGTIVRDAGSIAPVNGVVELFFRQVNSGPGFNQAPAVMGIYGSDGVLIERLANSRFEDRTYRRSYAPGTYYIAYGDETTEFQNRFLFQDYSGIENSTGFVDIRNDAGIAISTFGFSSAPELRQEWSTFTIIPAPGAATALLLLSGTLAGARRRR